MLRFNKAASVVGVLVGMVVRLGVVDMSVDVTVDSDSDLGEIWQHVTRQKC